MVNLRFQHDLIDTSRKLVKQVFSERLDHDALVRSLGGHFLLLPNVIPVLWGVSCSALCFP